jgi:hypothetical protein
MVLFPAAIDVRAGAEKRIVGSRADSQKAGIGIETQRRRMPFVVVETLASSAKGEVICLSLHGYVVGDR